MNLQQEIEIFKKGIAELISEQELLSRLKKRREEGKPLRVKYGVDPSAPDIHLGHTISLYKLKQLQEIGHQVIFVIGDFTAQIGDPTGILKKRKRLSEKEVKENASTYCQQVFKVLDEKKTEVVFNSKWLNKMSLGDLLSLCAHSTVAQMLARADFRERFEKNIDINIMEFLYPLLQGYDSVILHTDIEIGGTDQRFNLLLARELQRDYGQEPQIVITLPLLVGTDGKQKMSKSFNNAIGINEPPREIYGKIMSLSDETASEYLRIFTPLLDWKFSFSRIDSKQKKSELAKKFVQYFYDEESAQQSAEEFERVFRERKMPKDIPSVEIPRQEIKKGKIWLVRLLQITNLAVSRSEARRLIKAGAVFVDDMRYTDVNKEIEKEKGVVKVGRRFCRYIFAQE
ncbi:MAG: tyrosine--tRNA ligase [Candidatus Omnitrophota bacterium]|nr:MAG: tyrosine--tRNA ligase [Candidatus Omnitrophota bacterium]